MCDAKAPFVRARGGNETENGAVTGRSLSSSCGQQIRVHSFSCTPDDRTKLLRINNITETNSTRRNENSGEYPKLSK